MPVVIELFQYFGKRKKYWLLPVILLLAVLGGMLALTQGSVLAPFIYSLF